MVLGPRGGAGQGGRGGLGQIDYEGTTVPAKPVDRATLKRVFGFFRPYRGAVAGILASVVLSAVLGVIPPLIIKAIIDDVLPAGDLGLLAALGLTMIGIGIAAGLVQVLEQWLNLRIGQSVMFDLRNTLYQRVQAMPFTFFTTTRTGEIMSRLLGDVNAVQLVVTRTFVTAAQNFVTVAVTVAVMLTINWRLALVSLVALPFFIAPVRRAGRIRSRLTRETQAKIGDVSAGMQESLGINGMLLMKVFGRQLIEFARFRRSNAELKALQIRQDLAMRWFQMLVGLFGTVSPALVLWYGGWEVVRGALTVGGVVAFIAYIARIYTPVSQLFNVQVDILASLGLFERIFEYLDLAPAIEDKPGAVRPGRASGALRFEQVSFSYDGKRKALDDVSFDVEPGQMVALVGPSGAGKTTATYLIPRLYDPDEGRVSIDYHDLKDVPAAWIADQIGVVPQETFLFHTTVLDNLRYGDPDATEEQVVAAATAANIHDFIVGLPQGYGTVVGERGFRLSGGERQRIAIARALLKDPRIIVLDEATSSLDSCSERLVREALDRLLEGRTSVVIAHRLSTVLSADRILTMDQGRVVEAGTHAELVVQDGLYAQLYREQFESHPTGRPADGEPAQGQATHMEVAQSADTGRRSSHGC